MAQTYLWPTNASKNLTSSFAESRSDHFHAGIDIKTWGQEGYNIFATRDGYIWKVQISPFGYGKVIYQVLDSGEIAVYAHLQKFSTKLEQIMRQEQKLRHRYTVTKIFNPAALPVKQGDLLAYTGRTGIGYPHLHFEIRKNEETPINPLKKKFPITDSVSPLPLDLAVLPLNIDSQINGFPTPQIFPIQRLSQNSYRISKPIQIWGTIALAVNAFDQADGIGNRFAVYRLSLMLDDKTIFQSTYNEFTYGETNQIVLDRNFWLDAHTGKSFYNLYVESGNDLAFYQPFIEGQGILYTSGYFSAFVPRTDFYSLFFLKDPGVYSSNIMDQLYLQLNKKPYTLVTTGHHNIEIVLEDYFGNQSSLELELLVGEKVKPEQQWLNNPTPKEIEGLTANCFKWSKWQKPNNWLPIAKPVIPNQVSLSPSVLNDAKNLHIRSLPGTSLFRILNEQNPDIPTYPIYLSTLTQSVRVPQMQLATVVRDPFTVLTISSQQPITLPVYAKIQNDRLGEKSLPATIHDLENITVTIPSFDLSGDSTLFTLFTKNYSNETSILLQKKFYFTRVDYSGSASIISPDGRLEIAVPRQASNQNLYFIIEKIASDQLPLQNSFNSIVPVYRIEPTDVPLLKRLELTFTLPPGIDKIRQIGIYRPVPETHSWTLVGNSLDVKSGKIRANVKSLGDFTLLRDVIPPEIYFISPKPDAVLSNRLPEIRVQYKDDLANIGGEEDFRLTLDGQECISELDPEMHLVKYQPDTPLAAGKHTLIFWIQDRAGNQNQKSIIFTVGSN